MLSDWPFMMHRQEAKAAREKKFQAKKEANILLFANLIFTYI